jgi:HSP20 family protein
MKLSREPARANAGKRELAERRAPEHPLLALQQEMNRLFEGFFRGFDRFPSDRAAGASGTFLPRVDVTESEKEVRVTAEIPGLDEKDLDVSIARDALTLRGEKKIEAEEKRGNCYRMERSYGSFHRTIPLPAEVLTDRVEAEFKKGVLTVRLPKSPAAQRNARKITVRTE